MATIILTLNEVCQLITQDFPQHQALKEVNILPDGTAIRIDLRVAFLPVISVRLQFVTCQQGELRFAMNGGKMLNLVLKRLRLNQQNGIQIKKGELTVKVETLLKDKLPEFQLRKIEQKSSGDFVLTVELPSKENGPNSTVKQFEC